MTTHQEPRSRPQWAEAKRIVVKIGSSLLVDRKKLAELEGLLVEHRKADPADPEARRPGWDLEVKWLKKDYAGALKLLTAEFANVTISTSCSSANPCSVRRSTRRAARCERVKVLPLPGTAATPILPPR